MKSQPQFSVLALAVAAALGTAAVGQAQATPQNVSAKFNANNASATCSGTCADNNGTTTNNNVSAGSVALPAFDKSKGVLTGVQLSLKSTRTQTLYGSLKPGGKSGTGTGSIDGSSTAQLSAPGISSQSYTKILSHAQTSTSGSIDSTSSATTTDTASSLGVSSSNLNNYVGTSSSTVSGIDLTAPTISVTDGGMDTGTNTLNWDGTLSAAYSYLLHANPSFADSNTQTSLTLNFGTVNKNASVGPKSFNLYNDLFSSGSQVGLALTGITPGSGNSSALSTDLTRFSDLSSGSHNSYTASFDTSKVGKFSNTYTLALADVNPGGAATNSLKDYTMTLNLNGTVQAPTNPVPAPGSLAIMAAGLLGLAGIRKRRRR